ALSVEFLAEILFVEAPNPNLLCLLNFSLKFSLLGPQPQLALSVEFLAEILFVGGPNTKIYGNFYVLIIQWLYVKKV
ncbi:hypothetical protein, partial [Staphylococcus epidermidis]|uniref:hypothetical protein n=1 Tax=Staphylococcus epidermidis TaxID=1282 RepID=UPI00026C1CB7